MTTPFVSLKEERSHTLVEVLTMLNTYGCENPHSRDGRIFVAYVPDDHYHALFDARRKTFVLVDSLLATCQRYEFHTVEAAEQFRKEHTIPNQFKLELVQPGYDFLGCDHYDFS